jgi:hypothetical protein
MKSQPHSLEDLEDRLQRLEKQNRRLKQLVIAALIVPATLLVMGQVPSRKTVEANEFVLKDDSGVVRARLGMKSIATNKKYAAFELLDMKGETRIELFGDGIVRNAGLALSDETGNTRAVFGAGGIGAANQGGYITFMGQFKPNSTEYGLLHSARVDIQEGHLKVTDGQYSATLGTESLTTTQTGESHKSSAASLILFDNSDHVIWKAP